jgi:transposase
VINPVQVRAVRKLKGLERVKNDRVDSELIAETLRIGQFDETRLTDERVESLRTLTRYHQSLRAEAAEAKTQLLCVLDAYFPEYERLFSDPFCVSSLALLALAPLPADLARRREKTVADALSAASRGRIGRERAAEVKAAARSSVGYRVGSEAASFEVRSLVRTIEFLESEASQVAGRVAELLSEVEPLVLTIPGVGGVTGAQIVAEIGDIARFPNAKALVRYAGLDSSVNQSGQFDSGGGPITKHGSPYLRRAVWLAASRAWQYDGRLGDFYRKKRSEGKPHRVAVTAVARKLCHVIFAVMRDQEAYDASR